VAIKRLSLKSRRLNNIPLGNRYICLLQNNVAFIFIFRLKGLALWENSTFYFNWLTQ